MEVGRVPFHRRAFAAFNQLPADEQAQILECFTPFAEVPAADWPVGKAKKLQGVQPLYLVRVNDSLRLIIRAADGQLPEVQAIVRHETLESFKRTGAKIGN